MKKIIVFIGAATFLAACSESHTPKESLFQQVVKPEMIGASLQYLESLTGPARNVSADGNVRTYPLAQCELTAIFGGDKNKLVSALRIPISAGCDADVSGFIAEQGAEKLLTSQIDFAKFEAWTAGETSFLADCLSGCGNAFDPSVYQYWQGPRAMDFLEIMIEVPLVGDAVIAAGEKWREAMEKGEGEDWVVDAQFNCQPAKYKDVARLAFAQIRPTAITIGRDLPIPKCEVLAKAPVPASGGDQLAVPQPASDCDYEYDKTLKKAGFLAKEVMVHGPVDEDFPGYGCAYRIQPAPGTRLPKGAVVQFRSAYEGS
jgi:hypothetical protein